MREVEQPACFFYNRMQQGTAHFVSYHYGDAEWDDTSGEIDGLIAELTAQHQATTNEEETRMSSTPKTIQIFLPSGDPRGIRIAEITTRIVQVIEVPRSLLGEFFKMDESNQVAMYFLFGGEEDGGDQRVYIGQTGDLRARLKAHHANKDFWERALVLVSRTHSLTPNPHAVS